MQGIGISMICSWGMIAEPEDGKALQNLLICAEMLLASISMLFAFPHKEFKMGGATHALRLGAIGHAISIRDVINDTIHVVRKQGVPVPNNCWCIRWRIVFMLALLNA